MTMTTTNWHIANLERETSDGYVFIAHYTVDAKDDTYSAGAYGSIGLERPEGSLIAFADLTEEQVDRMGQGCSLAMTKLLMWKPLCKTRLTSKLPPPKPPAHPGKPWQ
jgi:hypothetical protein